MSYRPKCGKSLGLPVRVAAQSSRDRVGRSMKKDLRVIDEPAHIIETRIGWEIASPARERKICDAPSCSLVDD